MEENEKADCYIKIFKDNKVHNIKKYFQQIPSEFDTFPLNIQKRIHKIS